MTEAEWDAACEPRPMLEFLRDSGRLSDRKLRLFTAAVCRWAWPLLTHKRYRRVVEVAERFADGLADERQLRTALGDEADEYDWLGGVNDIAFVVSLPPAALDVRAAIRALSCSAHALGRAAYPDADFDHDEYLGAAAVRDEEAAAQAALLRCLYGRPPFHPPTVPAPVLRWHGGTVVRLAQAIYDKRRFGDLPVLADALEEAGCTDDEILNHCRGPGPHARGCGVLDLVLGKE
jgi:hypothetical protein